MFFNLKQQQNVFISFLRIQNKQNMHKEIKILEPSLCKNVHTGYINPCTHSHEQSKKHTLHINIKKRGKIKFTDIIFKRWKLSNSYISQLLQRCTFITYINHFKRQQSIPLLKLRQIYVKYAYTKMWFSHAQLDQLRMTTWPHVIAQNHTGGGGGDILLDKKRGL